ncbi:myeloid cell nuclear differentiation antigen [Acomys russatus]|uniref:myeloid cell nuclear differentiation antigen n=1 Tax=Acomys russatus TaxID=60746 RepID=UPI0021E27259|nr:myeloid cell nuclear differentiation antigen [Acomys russatus]
MASEYKKIVLLKGFQNMEDYQFRTIKSLLRAELKLTKKMQDEYDRIQMADLMEDKFPKDAGLDKLIDVCKDIEGLEDLAENLKTEKAKVKKQKKGGKQGEPNSSQSLSTNNESNKSKPSSTTKRKQPTKAEGGKKRMLTQEQTGLPEPSGTNIQNDESCLQTPHKPPPTSSSSSSKKTPHQSTARGAILQKDVMTVMVLKATDLFEYESSEHKIKTMFHATVATVNEYFHVKVFNIWLKEKFTKNNVIKISNYVKSKGILEINEDSFVVDAGPDEKIEVPNSVIKRANETPKISDIHKGVSGALFYGLFTLHKKNVKPKNTIYEIKDNTGNIDVVGNGKWYNIKCEEGDKLRLFCFQLKTIDKQPKLVCGEHSFIKVTKPGKKKETLAAASSTTDEEKHVYQQYQYSFFKVETPF